MIPLLLLCAELMPQHAVSFTQYHALPGTTNISIMEYEGLRGAAAATTDKPEPRFKKRFSRPNNASRFDFVWQGMNPDPVALFDRKTGSYCAIVYTNKAEVKPAMRIASPKSHDTR